MLTIIPEKEKRVEEIFAESGIEYNSNSGCVTAKDKEEVLGYCLYYLDQKSITILKLYPLDDLLLVDGILRSALHVAAEHSAMDAFYADTAPMEVFRKLNFIKNREEKRLDIDKLFIGCCDCQKG